MTHPMIEKVDQAISYNVFLSHDQYAMSRAAIRAALEYARDNVSQNVGDTVWAAIVDSMQDGPSPSHADRIVSEAFTALLKEIEE